MSLREKQIAAIKQMLNLNQPLKKGIAAEPVWKILVFDRIGQDIISPLISIKELRELGVTLHVQLESEREPVPDVPAVYLIAPTAENLARVAQDFQRGLYDAHHLNFISPVSRQRLEELASAALAANCVSQVHSVFDQHLNFISLEDDLFVLRHQNSEPLSYYALNRGEIKDTEMDSIMDSIVDGLFSVFATLGSVPVIRCARGNAAEMAAEKLDRKLRDNLRDTRNSQFAPDASGGGHFGFQRPLLVLIDRNIDLATPLHHTWTYQALAHDVLDLSLNRVVVGEGGGGGEGGRTSSGARLKTRVCDLDASDKFWHTHKGSPFPAVAEAIQVELESYRGQEDEVKRLKAGLDESHLANSVGGNTAKLTSAVHSLPQMLERKRLIDMHTDIATAILGSIKSRRLDSLFEFEEKTMSKAAQDRSLMDLLADADAGTAQDKLRLFLIYLICTPNMTEAEVERCSAALVASGADLSALTYVRRWKALTSMAQAAPARYLGGGTRTVGMFSKLVSQGSSFVMEGVKNLVVKKHNLPVTRLLDELMESRSSPETEDFRTLDPKQLRVDTSAAAKSRPPFTEAVVFVVGGGNYIEYQNLVDYAKGKPGGPVKRVIYGSSTLNNAKEFLKQLAMLGEEIH